MLEIRQEQLPVDPLLLPFLSTSDAGEASLRLERLLEEIVLPVIEQVIRRRWPHASGQTRWESADEAEARDIRGDALAPIIRRLRAVRADPTAGPIQDLRAYAAVTTVRACNQHIRERYPQRHRLMNRLRLLLTETEGLSLWETAEGWQCGFSVWQGRKPDRSARLLSLAEGAEEFMRRLPRGEDPARMRPSDLLAALFDWAGGTVDLDALVSVVAHLWGLKDAPVRLLSQFDGLEEMMDGARAPDNVEAAVQSRADLRHLWCEILQLPVRQRSALLLNLRGPSRPSPIELFVLLGVAALRDIARALEMRAEELEGLWDDLPLEDAVLAERLGCTRQQVIGLRDAAKRRLRRHLEAAERLPELPKSTK